MSDALNDTFRIGCELMWAAPLRARVRFDHESLPVSRGWEHAFSMAPVARRKRVAAALFKAVMK